MCIFFGCVTVSGRIITYFKGKHLGNASKDKIFTTRCFSLLAFPALDSSFAAT
jgi:hypothetical protein